MKRLIIIFIILFAVSNFVYSERYEPIIGKSGSVIDFGMIRILSDWSMSAKGTTEYAVLNFGLDFGVGPRTELQNRFEYSSINDSEYDWKRYKGLLKLRISEVANGPAVGLGIGVSLPFYSKKDSIGVIGGLYISSALKDIDFDLNLGVNPFLTYVESYKTSLGWVKQRPHSFANLDILFGYKILPFLKANAGVQMKHYFGGAVKTPLLNDEVNVEKNDSATAWALVLGGRIKPVGYPILLDGSMTFGLNDKSEYDWTFKLGIQLLPQAPNADW